MVEAGRRRGGDADIPWWSRGGAAARTRIFRGGGRERLSPGRETSAPQWIPHVVRHVLALLVAVDDLRRDADGVLGVVLVVALGLVERVAAPHAPAKTAEHAHHKHDAERRHNHREHLRRGAAAVVVARPRRRPRRARRRRGRQRRRVRPEKTDVAAARAARARGRAAALVVARPAEPVTDRSRECSVERSRRDAAAATWIFRREESPRLRAGSSPAVGRAKRGSGTYGPALDSAPASSRIVRGGRTREGGSGTEPSTPPRPLRGYFVRGKSRRRRGRDVDIQSGHAVKRQSNFDRMFRNTPAPLPSGPRRRALPLDPSAAVDLHAASIFVRAFDDPRNLHVARRGVAALRPEDRAP